MKRLLIGAAAAFALVGAASAQPAYDSSQGPAPSDYPKCTQPGQDRCVSGGHMAKAGHHKMHRKMHKGGKGEQTTKDGERG